MFTRASLRCSQVYSLPDLEFITFALRCSQPVRAVSVARQQNWMAIAGDELEIHIAAREDDYKVEFWTNFPILYANETGHYQWSGV